MICKTKKKTVQRRERLKAIPVIDGFKQLYLFLDFKYDMFSIYDAGILQGFLNNMTDMIFNYVVYF